MQQTSTIFDFHTLGQVIAINISEAVYMRDYAEHFCEWVNGTVIKMSPVHERHDTLTRYLTRLIEAYLEMQPIGDIRIAPFVMRLTQDSKRTNREPDIQVILDNRADRIHPTYVDGAANLVVEIVSNESRERDYGEKLYEYEQAGVLEYWIIDPAREECRFYERNSQGRFILAEADMMYNSKQLPNLTITLATLWEKNLPGPAAIVKQIEQMLR